MHVSLIWTGIYFTKKYIHSSQLKTLATTDETSSKFAMKIKKNFWKTFLKLSNNQKKYKHKNKKYIIISKFPQLKIQNFVNFLTPSVH